MTTRLSVRDELDLTLRRHPTETGDFLVGFVVIAEWLHADGERSLTLSANEGSTPWQRSGYLSDALEGEGWD